ncbi:Soluble NSF attachment protein, SNAP [Plasmodiophora brassicae]|uniref:Uncharacterized protein n=2 Tax=Plasmodiophora brassicae TaxID=37360 RepID=A0A3P3YB95_PLABS|nr:unnamed protein product [Plasmodiophora brassicae]
MGGSDDDGDLCPEGDKLRAEADKRLKSLNLFGAASKRLMDAAELYGRAANKYRVARLWKKAGETHMAAANNYHKASQDGWIDARKNYEEAAKCFAKCNPEDALEAYKCAAQLSLEENSFSMAAHHYKSMGEICEDEELDIEQTIEAYSKAADCFETADSPKNAIEMTMKVAFFNAKIEQYDRAIEAYKKVVEGSTKGASKSTGEMAAVNCVLCHLAGKDSTTEQAEAAFESYKDAFDSLERSTFGRLLDGLLQALRHGDVDEWESAVTQAEKKSPMTPFHKSMIAQAQKAKLESAAEPQLT